MADREIVFWVLAAYIVAYFFGFVFFHGRAAEAGLYWKLFRRVKIDKGAWLTGMFLYLVWPVYLMWRFVRFVASIATVVYQYEERERKAEREEA